MKNVVFFFLLSLFIIEPGYSQVDKVYSETLREANEYLLEEDYNETLNILLKLENKGYTFPNIDYWIGYCYLHSNIHKDLAISRFENAVKYISEGYDYTNFSETKAPVESYLFLGDAYLVNNQLANAKMAYQKYEKLVIDPNKKAIAQQRLKDVLVAKVLKKENNDCKVTNAGALINTGISNSNACISGDGKAMVYLKKLKFYNALYYTTKGDSGWIEPINITSQVGSDGYHIPTALSADGKKMLLQVFNTTTGYDIFESSFNGKKWSKAKIMPTPINSKFNEIDATYSSSNKYIIFSSNREGGFGGHDLYTTSYPVVNGNIIIKNIGNTINTAGNEKSPMLFDKDSLIVYNSDLLYGMGGFDYYHARLMPNNTYSAPINLGIPFNTSNDDDQLKLTTGKKEGVISRTDPSGYGETDVLTINYTKFGNFRFIPVNGKLRANIQTFNDSTQNLTLVLVDNATKDTIDITTTDSLGNYNTNLYPGDFSLIIKNRNAEKIENIALSDTISRKNIELVSYIEPETPVENVAVATSETTEANKTAIMPDTVYIPRILFEFNQSELSTPESEKISTLAQKLPSQQIKIIKLTGYTDAIGPLSYNLTLSLNRAKSVKTLMVQLGLPESLIKIEGKGKTGFIAPNYTSEGIDNPEGRALNRRVEIEIQLIDNKQFIIKNLAL